MQKKGSSWMTEETAKFFIALMVIILMLMLIVTLGKMFFQNTQYEQAKATLLDLKKFMSGLSDGKEGYFLVEAPEDWNILTDGKSKLCICPTSTSWKSCQDSKGVCENTDRDAILSSSCRFSADGYLTTYPYCIQISKVPLNLRITKYNQNYLFGGFSSEILDDSLNRIIISKELTTYFTSSDSSQLEALLKKEFTDLQKQNENYESYQFFIRDETGQEIFYYSPNKGFLRSTLEFSSAGDTYQNKKYFLEFDMMELKTGGFPFS